MGQLGAALLFPPLTQWLASRAAIGGEGSPVVVSAPLLRTFQGVVGKPSITGEITVVTGVFWNEVGAMLPCCWHNPPFFMLGYSHEELKRHSRAEATDAVGAGFQGRVAEDSGFNGRTGPIGATLFMTALLDP